MIDHLPATWHRQVMSVPWSEQEVRLAVSDYFEMLLDELKGEKYVKALHNKMLVTKLDSRSRGSVEFKHENISAVLLELELPYIDGYKPRKNIQGILRDIVGEYADKYRDQLAKVAVAGDVPKPQPLHANDWKAILVEPPPLTPSEKGKLSTPPRQGRKFNFAEQEFQNRTLGRLGEEFVMEYESIRLESLGKRDLVKRIEWVSEKDDTAGFDILSFGDDGRERFIEVKTTNCGRRFPFVISRNEVEFSHSKADRYALYRLFTFRADPRLFMLHGDVNTHCQLEPKTYRASFSGAELANIASNG